MNHKELLKKALEQTKYSYAPYSGFHVGAALLTKEGEVFLGNNVENASFGAGICAERNAIFQAVSKGKKAFETIAVVGGKCQENGGIQVDGFCYPCGICLQVMEEFCEDDFQVIFADSADLEVANIQVRTLKELMPYGFKL